MTSTPESSIEYQMNAFVIYAIKNGEKINFPSRFMSKIQGTSIDQRWDNPEPTPGSICKNIVSISQVPSNAVGNEIVFEGQLVEVTFQEKLDLLGWDGTEIQHPLPPQKGPREVWSFRICPKYNLLVLENGRSVEKKAAQYLNFFCIQKYNTGLPETDQLDGILIEAVPVESNPVGFLRSNPHLGSFEAVVNAKEFQKNTYGAFSNILSGLDSDEERLIVKFSISSQRRGHNLPQVLVTNLASFIESISEDDLSQARASEYDDGKKLRPTKLLGAFQHRKKRITDEDDAKKTALNLYIAELIRDIGEELVCK